MSDTTNSLTTHLAETIVTIQNELQTAIDYFDAHSRNTNTEGGTSQVFMTPGNIKVKIPVVMNASEETHEDPTPPPPPPPPPADGTEIEEEVVKLKNRLGIRLGDGDGGGIYSKILVQPPPPESTPELIATLEITFTPTEK